MTTTAGNSRWEYNGDGATTDFAYDARVFAASDLKVWVDGALQTLTTHYSVTGVGNAGGGNVVMVTEPPAGTNNVVIVSDVAQEQGIDFQDNDAFPAEVTEGGFDRLTRLVQDARMRLARTLRLADETVSAADLTLPALDAGKVLAANAAGDALEWQDPPADGADGAPGADGDDGADGADGNTILSGSGAPAGGLGVDGDLYYDTANDDIYGPKAGGAWGSATSLVGPAGANGSDGADGRTILSGSGAPAGGTGTTGDFYIDTTANDIYGPKSGGAWGGGTSLVGPQGPQGDQGIQGPQGDPGADGADGAGVVVGGSTGQVLAKASATDFDTEWITVATGGLSNVVEDETPQLGGNLDLNGFDFTSAAAFTISVNSSVGVTFNDGSVSFTDQILMNVGSGAAPSIGVVGDTDTGVLGVVGEVQIIVDANPILGAEAGLLTIYEDVFVESGVELFFTYNPLNGAILGEFGIQSAGPSSASGVLTLDYELGPDFEVTMSENITSIVIDNSPPSGSLVAISLNLKQPTSGTHTLTDSTTDYGDAGAPTMPTGTGAEMEMKIWSRDGFSTRKGSAYFEKAGS